MCVTEHRLVSATARSEWIKSYLQWVMLGLVLSVSRVLLWPCLLLLLLGLRGFFGLGRAVRCLVPVGCRRFTHLVVLYGYFGADSSAEKLQLTNQLFEAALGELAVVARGQPCLIVGDFNVESTKIPCLAKGISAGLIWKLPGLLQLVVLLQLPVSAHGTLTLEIGGIFRLDAHCVLLLFYLVKLLATGGFSLILLLGPGLLLIGGLLVLLSLVGLLLFGLPLGFLQLIGPELLCLLRFVGFGMSM